MTKKGLNSLKKNLAMSTPGCVKLDEVFSGLDVLLEGLLGQDIQAVVDNWNLGFGCFFLKQKDNVNHTEH